MSCDTQISFSLGKKHKKVFMGGSHNLPHVVNNVILWCDGEPLAPKVPVSDRRSL